MADLFITEYSEQTKTAQEFVFSPESVKDHVDLDDHEHSDSPMVITFDEEMTQEPEPQSEVMIIPMDIKDVFEFSEGGEQEDEALFEQGLGFALPGTESDEVMDEAPPEFRLPGAVDYVDDDEEEEPEEDLEEKQSDWMNDRDSKHFMEYILAAYPEGIPSHDGHSTLGCEKAILYLTHLNKEVSEALRSDKDDALDLPTLEKLRVNMVRDVVSLKEHIKKLNKKHKKTSSSSNAIVKDAELKKEATTARFTMVITPWERAITGMIINSVVSAGKPFEDVYEFLKKKYKFTDREELAILQILMDMGQPIFKDRGTIGESMTDADGDGVDFMKNYFA
jgi:hypothetical protein